jgi:hypothetical protein
MTPDDYLGPRVHGTVHFEDGWDYEVTARPRKGVGFTDETMIGFKPVGKRGCSAMQAGILRWFVSSPDRSGETYQDMLLTLTKNDARAVLAWMDGLIETRKGEGE